jgi:ribonuclease P protein component
MNSNTREEPASFSKHNRISQKKDFDYVLKHGKRFKCTAFTLIITYNNHPANRLGIRMSKKIGNAVVRNKIKRRLKEIFRLTQHMLKHHLDIVIIPHNAIREKSYHELHEEYIHQMNIFF